MTQYSKIKKDPASQGFRYVQYALDHRTEPNAFYDLLKAETDAALAAMVERRVTQGTFMLGPPAPVDPLDVEYDGVKLRISLLVGRGGGKTTILRVRALILLIHDERARRERDCNLATPAQRAAISAHWSAELRAKVAAAQERDRRRVVVDLEEP